MLGHWHVTASLLETRRWGDAVLRWTIPAEVETWWWWTLEDLGRLWVWLLLLGWGTALLEGWVVEESWGWTGLSLGGAAFALGLGGFAVGCFSLEFLFHELLLDVTVSVGG